MFQLFNFNIFLSIKLQIWTNIKQDKQIFIYLCNFSGEKEGYLTKRRGGTKLFTRYLNKGNEKSFKLFFCHVQKKRNVQDTLQKIQIYSYYRKQHFSSWIFGLQCKETRFHGHKVLCVPLLTRRASYRQVTSEKTQARRRERERRGRGRQRERERQLKGAFCVKSSSSVSFVILHFCPLSYGDCLAVEKENSKFIFRSSTTFYLLPQHLLHGRVIILTFP